MTEPELHQTIPADLALALRVLVDENIGDFFYEIRDREGKGWEGPRLKNYGEACTLIEKYAAPPGSVVIPKTPEEIAVDELLAKRNEIDAEIAKLRGQS